MEGADVIQLMNTQQIIARTFRLYGRHLASLVLVALGPHVALLLAVLFFEKLSSDPMTLNVLTMFATVVMNAVALAAITVAVALAATAQAPSVGAVYRLLRGRNPLALVLAYLITVIATSVAFVPVLAGLMAGGLMVIVTPIMIIPGLVLGGLFAATIPVIVLERRSALAGIARSMGLMRRDLTKATAIFAFVLLISGFLPMGFHLTVGLGPLSPLLNTVLGSALLPLAYTANVLLYFSARAGEGYTAELLAGEMQGR
ncbi:MAG: hypothetical protein HY342_12660 [Candidatus Lambdaproteobacteria bacterium]|nr:hypothetical protein [Candidatus Lambdaproteobacteria bacterium]